MRNTYVAANFPVRSSRDISEHILRA